MNDTKLPIKKVVIAIAVAAFLVVAAVVIRILVVPWPPFFMAVKSLPANTPKANIENLKAAYDRVRKEPFGYFSWNQLGTAWYVIGDNRQAINAYEEALTHETLNWETQLNLARVYISVKDWENARIHFAEAHRQRMDQSSVCMEYGDLLRERFWPAMVNELGQNYVDCINNNGATVFYERLGNTYRDAGRYTEALAIYEQLQKAAPEYPGIGARIGDTMNLQKEADLKKIQ